MPVTFGQSLSLRKPSFPNRFVHHAHRPDCFVDEDTGIEHCNVLSRGARIGIILGICNFYPFSIVPMDLSISLLETHRRPLSPVDHRLRNTSQATKCPGNLEFIQQTRVAGGNIGGVPPSFPPQYPPQGYNGSAYAFDSVTGFAPPAASQRDYPPPPGPPPMSSGEYKSV
ncbi:hypothetical protein BGW80DRAFT_596453 [Lactifluus volemus]|nr:hypothetical protein BGW80DRAFT_596453 [Lactifluus volemus]